MTLLAETIRGAFAALSEGLRVSMPGTIQSYDPSSGLATVQPGIKILVRGGDAIDYPILSRVPVIQPGTAAASIHLPVAPGDLCLLIFLDRSASNWIAGDGSPAEPLGARMHDLSDAVALVGLSTERSMQPPANPDAVNISLRAGTKLAINNDAGDDLIGLLASAIDLIIAQTLTADGSPVIVADPRWTLIQQKLKTFLAPGSTL